MITASAGGMYKVSACSQQVPARRAPGEDTAGAGRGQLVMLVPMWYVSSRLDSHGVQSSCGFRNTLKRLKCHFPSNKNGRVKTDSVFSSNSGVRSTKSMK